MSFSSPVSFSAELFIPCLFWFLSSTLKIFCGWKLWTWVWGLWTLSFIIMWCGCAICQKTMTSVTLGLLGYSHSPRDNLSGSYYLSEGSLVGRPNPQHPRCMNSPEPVVCGMDSISSIWRPVVCPFFDLPVLLWNPFELCCLKVLTVRNILLFRWPHVVIDSFTIQVGQNTWNDFYIQMGKLSQWWHGIFYPGNFPMYLETPIIILFLKISSCSASKLKLSQCLYKVNTCSSGKYLTLTTN